MNVKSKSRPFDLLWPLFCIAGSAAILYGIHRIQNKGFELYWSKDQRHDLLVWGAGCAAAGVIVRWLAPARAKTIALGLAAVYFAMGIGPAPAAAAVLFFASCMACGRLALEIAFPDEPLGRALTKTFVTGLALELALFSILIHFPVNSGLRYAILLALPIAAYLAMRRPPVGAALARWANAGDVLPDLPFWLLVLGIAACGVGLRFAFLPGVDYDTNAIHLRMWTDLAFRHRFNFDVQSQVWNVGPYLVDLSKAVVSLVAGRDGRAAVGLGLLVLLIRQMWVVADRFGLKASDRLLLAVALISTPMTGWLVVAMPAELMFALLAMAGVRLALEARAETGRGDATAILAVAALCCGTKMNGAVLGLCLLLVAAPRLWTPHGQLARLFDPRRLWPIAGFVLVFTITALGAYIVAWRVARNPFFPMYNGIFKSPDFAPVNFADARWTKGFGPRQFVELFFRTSKFGEHYDLVAGFQYLFLMPVGLAVVAWRYRKDLVAWAICVPVLVFGLVMFVQLQYMRYAFPILPAATLAIGALLATSSRTAVGGWSMRAAVLFCVGLNLLFYPGVSWIFRSAVPQASFTEAGKRAQIEAYAPARAVAEDIASRDSDPHVLFPESTPFGAALKGEPIYVDWYAPAHQALYAAIHSEADAGTLMQAYGVTHAIWDTHPTVKPGEPAAFLGAWLHRHAVPQGEIGGFVDYALTGVDPVYRPLFDLNAALAAQSTALDLPVAGASRQAGGGLALLHDLTPVAKVELNYARILRYRVTFRCADPAGTFMADINFDRGAAFHRAVSCAVGPVDFEDAFPIPLGAETGQIFATFRDTAGGQVSALTLETN